MCRPIIKGPKTQLLFLSPLMWRFARFTKCSQVLFWAKHRSVYHPCPRKHHVSITSNAQETKAQGWQHQTNVPISHCILFQLVSQHGQRRARLHGNICTVKAERSHSAGRPPCSQLRSTQIKEHRMYSQDSCDQRRTSCSLFPHSYTNSPLTRSEKFDFQLSPVLFLLLAPCLVLTQPADPLHAPPPPLPPALGRRGPRLGCDWSSLAAPTWRPAAG